MIGSLLLLAVPGIDSAAQSKPPAPKGRNVIVFVADGLRHGSVNQTDSPTMLELRRRGVHFLNSHALFPTFTTANASAIATGHLLGDTGDFSNTIYVGYPTHVGDKAGKPPIAGERTVTPFLENDAILREVDEHFGGNFLHETSLMAVAREHGYNTAVVGKIGPVGVQDAGDLLKPGPGGAPQTIFVDDSTGLQDGIPLAPEVLRALKDAKLAAQAPTRSNGCKPRTPCDNGYSGTNSAPGTTSPNRNQQQWFADVLTRAVLPIFLGNGKPFVVLFWSRDPDGTQHNQGDSLNTLTPGIGGPTSRAAIHNADNNLRQILDFLRAHPGIEENTDIFLTADHGYATISRHTVDAAGTPTRSYAASFRYGAGADMLPAGFLPSGFLAIDLAHALGLPMYDPDSVVGDGTRYARIDPSQPATAELKHTPANGSGLLGGSGAVLAHTDAEVVVAANGGSDLLYVPTGNKATLARIVAFLSAQDYVGAIFTDPRFGKVPGALPMSDAGLSGSALTPHPAAVVSFRTFYLEPGNLQSAVQIADTSLRQGQGMHGSFGRDNTYNNMAAIGPDFRAGFEDVLPVSNADITPTLAAILGWKQPPGGKLRGRVASEALSNGQRTRSHVVEVSRISTANGSGKRTVLHGQRLGSTFYFDEACMLLPSPAGSAGQSSCGAPASPQSSVSAR